MGKSNFTDEDFDLGNATRDGLRLVLDTAKDELEKYTNYAQKIERINKNIEKNRLIELKSKKDKQKYSVFLLLTVVFAVIIFIAYIGSSEIALLSLFVLPVLILAILYFELNHREKVAHGNINKYKSQLPELYEKAKEAKDEFKATWLVPEDYCYEYALDSMLRYIDNKRADTWKEATALYEEDLHRNKIEGNARIMAEEAIKQTEIGMQNRNASRMAAAGAWAAALGIWRR